MQIPLAVEEYGEYGEYGKYERDEEDEEGQRTSKKYDREMTNTNSNSQNCASY